MGYGGIIAMGGKKAKWSAIMYGLVGFGVASMFEVVLVVATLPLPKWTGDVVHRAVWSGGETSLTQAEVMARARPVVLSLWVGIVAASVVILTCHCIFAFWLGGKTAPTWYWGIAPAVPGALTGVVFGIHWMASSQASPAGIQMGLFWIALSLVCAALVALSALLGRRPRCRQSHATDVEQPARTTP